MIHEVIVDLQGFKDYKNGFIIKEFAIATREYTQTFLVKPPWAYSLLTNEEKKTVNWIERNRGIQWREGFMDIKSFKKIIQPYLKDKTVLVKGSEKIKWVKELCESCNVFDLTDKDCPNLSTLQQLYEKNIYPDPKSYQGDAWYDYCGRKDCFLFFCNHKKNCALKNVLFLKKWILDNNCVISD